MVGAYDDLDGAARTLEVEAALVLFRNSRDDYSTTEEVKRLT
jgi:hypothetical protein